jgi:hypothetical protein
MRPEPWTFSTVSMASARPRDRSSRKREKIGSVSAAVQAGLSPDALLLDDHECRVAAGVNAQRPSGGRARTRLGLRLAGHRFQVTFGVLLAVLAAYALVTVRHELPRRHDSSDRTRPPARTGLPGSPRGGGTSAVRVVPAGVRPVEAVPSGLERSRPCAVRTPRMRLLHGRRRPGQAGLWPRRVRSCAGDDRQLTLAAAGIPDRLPRRALPKKCRWVERLAGGRRPAIASTMRNRAWRYDTI